MERKRRQTVKMWALRIAGCHPLVTTDETVSGQPSPSIQRRRDGAMERRVRKRPTRACRHPSTRRGWAGLIRKRLDSSEKFAMNRKGRALVFVHLVALAAALLASTTTIAAQDQRGFLSLDRPSAAASALHDPFVPAECTGPISLVTDVGYEGVQTT